MTKPTQSIPEAAAPHEGADGPAAPDLPEPRSSTISGMRPSGTVPALLRKQCSACGALYPHHFQVCPTDATRLIEITSHETDPLVGSVLAETYEVTRIIGEGGMGRVYEARHVRLYSKRFAIKVLHGDLIRQPEAVARFLREAEATSALHHPNIVGVIDVNELADGRPFIVAELLCGHQLGDYLEVQGKLSIEEAVALCRPICQALIAAHDKDIVHRDIKPENLFVVGEGSQRTVKVLDFGISQVGDAAASFTKTGMVMGTPAYMPPEQARGQRVDYRADIYAVGAILYEALTGKPPFERSDPIATLGAVLTRAPAAPSTLAPEIPQALERVVQKAMEKLPERRYASMREMDAALAEFDRSSALPAAVRRDATSKPQPDAYAKGMVGRLQQAARAPGHARTRLWALSALASGLVLAQLVAIGFGLARAVIDPDVSLSLSQWLVTACSAVGLLGVGVMAWAHHLFWHIWPSTPRVRDTLARTSRAVTAGAAAYALSMALLRAGAALQGVGANSWLSWMGWDCICFGLSLVAAIGMWRLDRPLTGEQ